MATARLIRGGTLAWMAVLAALAIGLLPRMTIADTGALVVDDLAQVASRRASRVLFDYDFNLTVTNTGPDAFENVVVTVASSSPDSAIVESTVNVGAIGPGETITTSDTFTFRQNRRVRFDPGVFSYDFAGDVVGGGDTEPPLIEILTPPDLSVFGPDLGSVDVSVRATDNVGLAAVTVNGAAPVQTNGDVFLFEVPIGSGTNTVLAVAEDGAGNSANDSITVFVDDVPPTVEILEPVAGVEITGPNLVARLRATDDRAGVDMVLLRINGQDVQAAPLGDDLFEISGFPLSPQIASLSLVGVAVDQVGNVGTSAEVVVPVADITPPTVQIGAPANGAVLGSGSVTVSGTATDNIGVVDVNITNGGSTSASVSGNSFTATLTLAEGAHTITATASDAAGNSASQSVDVVIDLTAPTVDILSPADGATLMSSPVEVRFTATNPQAVSQASVNGVPAVLTGGVFVASVPLAEGANTLTASATDLAGNTGTDSVDVVLEVANTPPALLINAPINGTEVLTDMPTVAATYSDPDGIDVSSFTLLLDGASAPFACSTLDATQAVCTFDNPLPGGSHQVDVSIADLNGAVASASSTFNINIDVPLVTIQFPSAGQVLNQLDVQVRVSATDFDGIAAVTVGGVPAMQPDPDASLYLADVTLEPGDNTLTAVATDTLGNVGQAQVSFRVDFDMTPPTIQAVSPADGGQVPASPIDVTVRVTDDTGVAGVTIGGVAASASGDLYSASVPLAEGANGVLVIATDVSGNQASRTLSIDLNPPDVTSPTVAILSPGAGAQTDSRVDVLVQVDDDKDPANAMVMVRAGSRTFPAASSGPGQFSARVPLAIGNTTLTATATDLAGNTGTSAPVPVSLEDLTPPEIRFTVPADNLLLTSNAPELRVSYSDPSGINVDTLTFRVDGQPVTHTCASKTDAAARCVLDNPLPEGPVLIEADIQDNAGKSATASVNVNVDSIPVAIDILSPANNLITQDATVDVSGAVDASASQVTVNGVEATVGGGTFTASAVPLRGGKNMLVALARKASGRTGSDSVDVTRDNIAPIVQITTPKANAVIVNPTVAVVGQVNDIVNGATDPVVFVNGILATVNGGSYMLVGLPLVPGENTIDVEARDVAGNVGRRSITVLRSEVAGARVTDGGGNGQAAEVRTELPQPIMAQVVDELGNPVAGRVVTFTIQRNNGSLVPVGGGTPTRSLQVVTDGSGKASARWTLGDTSGEGNNQVLATALGVAGSVDFCATALPTPADKILMTMGDNQRGLVGSPLATPLEAMVIDVNGNPLSGVDVTFAVERGGGNIDGQMSTVKTTGSDGIARAVLTLGPNPGINNNVVVASFEGLASRPATFTSSGLAASNPADTRLSGVVVDNGFKAIPGAVVKVNSDGPSAITDEDGQFTITGVPVGFVDLFIDPINSPRPEKFPKLHFETTTVAGQNNTIGMPISLPIVQSEGSAVVGGDQDVVITMPGVPGLSLKVFANSVTCPDGSSECVVSISQVHLDKVPMPPPSGTLFMPPAWTVQTAGTRFDPPAQISIPNDGLPPGRQIQIYQFDHDLNQFIDIGKGTVTEDGLLIVSDPGFGITAAGWGGCGQPQPPTTCTISCDDQNNCTSDSVQDPPCACQHMPANEGGTCGGMDGGANSCVENGVCMNGACVGMTKADGEACDDDVFCTMPDMCEGGVCKGTKVEDREFPTAKVEINLDGILNAVESFASIMGVPLNLSFTVESSATLKKICCEEKMMKDVSVKKVQDTFKAKLETDPIPVPALSFNIRVVKIGVAVQIGFEGNANLNGENNLCTDELCWGGGIGVSAGAKGGLLVEAGEVVNIFGSLGSALKFEGGVTCEKINYGVSHDGLKGEITAEFLDGFIVIGLEKNLIPGGPIASGMIPLPSL